MFEIPGKPLQNFVAHLKGFDGEYKLFATRKEAENWLNDEVVKSDKKVFSAAEGVKGNVALGDFPTPAAMNTIEVCIAESPMAVGETGSLLVTDRTLGDPAAALFSTDLYLMVDRNAMVDGLQEAYSKIDFADAQYTAFFSGPSATADIEAVHITGAQGEISLTAVMYNCSPADFDDVAAIMDRLPQGTPLGQPDAPALALRRETDLTLGQDSI